MLLGWNAVVHHFRVPVSQHVFSANVFLLFIFEETFAKLLVPFFAIVLDEAARVGELTVDWFRSIKHIRHIMSQAPANLHTMRLTTNSLLTLTRQQLTHDVTGAKRVVRVDEYLHDGHLTLVTELVLIGKQTVLEAWVPEVALVIIKTFFHCRVTRHD